MNIIKQVCRGGNQAPITPIPILKTNKQHNLHLITFPGHRHGFPLPPTELLYVCKLVNYANYDIGDTCSIEK